MKRSRSLTLEQDIVRLIEECPFSMKSDVIAQKVGANIEAVRLALMDLSTDKTIHRSHKGYYRLVPDDLMVEPYGKEKVKPAPNRIPAEPHETQ